MSTLFGNIAFLNPLILAGLGALPLLWFLLRVMPPVPKLVVFPAMRFLARLIPEHQTPSHTPWWILLLRLLIAALVLIALAHPVYNPASEMDQRGAARLVIDNGWASAQTWDKQMRAAEETLARAERAERDIYILTTAPQPGQTDPAMHGPVTGGQAAAILGALEPLPWPANYETATTLINDQKPDQTTHSFWFAHGLDEGDLNTLAKALQAQGSLNYISPEPENLPLMLKAPEGPGSELAITIVVPDGTTENRPVTVQALTEAGQVIDRKTVTLTPGMPALRISFDIPETLRGEIAQIRLAGQAGTGGTFILDDSFHQRSVGIAGPADEAETRPFIEDIYYLKRALEPYSTLHIGNIETLLEHNPSMIILPDVAAMPAATLNNLETWVNEGGLLLRFAGPNMTEATSQPFLVPLPLRPGRRSTEGSLSWENPPKLKEFPKDSPLYGISIHDDITVRQQILPETTPDLEEKTWASLDDGTPLITATAQGKGLLVMVHTTASAEWSDLALSGVYVDILRRLGILSTHTGAKQISPDGFLNPLWVFDGMARVQNPENWIKPIPAAGFKSTPPGPEHPPGLYGRGGIQQALNPGNHISTLKATDNLPAGVQRQTYTAEYELDLMPYMLFAALSLLLLDWLIMMAFTSGLHVFTRFASIALVIIVTAPQAHATDDLTYADGLYLAYIRTGDPAVDNISHKGLENLAKILARRTSAEPDGIAALNPEYDSLAFFPLVYWPISTTQKTLSDKALKNIQHYLDHGGTILFDTRDQNYAASALAGSKNTEQLRRMVGFLNIPPLEPIAGNHVLGRSFYLLDSFPGRHSGGTVWVESTSANGRDGVSSVIIGSHDWASAWAMERTNRSTLGSGARQQELANRFGVNLVMYALTGNYKADQVHVPHILERLGQ